MEKIFLSHSSYDKEYVRPIFEYFGADRCFFDEMTFEVGMKTLDEIFTSIDKTDIFVFFISDHALNSEWVKQEIYKAQEYLYNNSKRLFQIFPIIIDEKIQHDDPRIPNFLKNGATSYNLRHILNYKIACKKIDMQLIKLQMDLNISIVDKNNFFYGRDIEKKELKIACDTRDENGKLKNIKCMVVSGIDGIGRKAYARAVLKDMSLVEQYYYPMLVDLVRNDTIDDFIMKLSNDLGLGEYQHTMLGELGSMDSKIDILAELLKNAQRYREIIFVEDDMCLVKNSEIQDWFIKALEQIGKKITVVIITRIAVNHYNKQYDKQIFKITLQNLEPSDTYGFLRGYSRLQGIPFEEEDIDFFTEILSGYPLQIQYCVELAKDYGGIQYVKDHSRDVAEMPKANSAKILNLVIENSEKKEYEALLALLAKIGTMPLDLMNCIIKTNDIYDKIFARLKMFTICTYIGGNKEYLRLNSVIREHVLRIGLEMNDELRNILNDSIKKFSQSLDDDEYMNYLSFSEFSYYVKESLKNNKKLPDRFLYTTVYVKAIIELYNARKYDRVIELVDSMKETRIFSNSAKEVQNLVQFYKCSSLARKKDVNFDSEVSYFKDYGLMQQYNFLKGFYFRMQGQYSKAEDRYLKVLERESKHKKALRELVLIYINMQDYESAFELAKNNYKLYSENMYQMQAYFDCLMYRKNRTDDENNDIKNIISMIESIYRTTPNVIYFQLKAKYEAFMKNDKDAALEYINEGIHSNVTGKFYLYRDYFDICRCFGDKEGMELAYDNLSKMAREENSENSIAMKIRKVYLDAAQGKMTKLCEMNLRSNNNMTKKALETHIRCLNTNQSIK